jgi:uncharacterized protein GlcG (DUF336 family)
MTSPKNPGAGNLSLEVIARASEQALSDAARNGWLVSIAFVDAAGFLRHLARMNGAIGPSAEIATLKARTAAIYRVGTGVLEAAVEARAVMSLLPDALPIEGGIPIELDGNALGGIGVSGAEAQQDLQIAQAALRALGK